MTTEDDFNALLDANPDDHGTRLVFADWLQERGDERADGYRALGMLRVRTDRWSVDMGKPPGAGFHFFWSGDPKAESVLRCRLPADWYAILPPAATIDGFEIPGNTLYRRQVEDAAARAFARLPPARRAELLAAPAAPEPVADSAE